MASPVGFMSTVTDALSCRPQRDPSILAVAIGGRVPGLYLGPGTRAEVSGPRCMWVGSRAVREWEGKGKKKKDREEKE